MEREREITCAFIIIRYLNQHKTVAILFTIYQVNLELLFSTIRGRVRGGKEFNLIAASCHYR